MIFGKLFKFTADYAEYDGAVINEEIEVHATGYTEACEYLQGLQFRNIKLVVED